MSDPRAAQPVPEAQATESPDQKTTLDGVLGESLERIFKAGRFGKDPESRERSVGMIRDYVAEVLNESITISDDTDAAINKRIAQIDHLVSLQLNEILHHPEFQRLEAAWRGLRYLLDESETSDQLKLKLFHVPKAELLRDLEMAPEFDQSALFRKVYEEEFGMFGGSPFGAMIGDYEFDHSPQDVELLKKVSQVAAAAHAPFIAGTKPEMFGIENFTQLDTKRDLSSIFGAAEYVKWRSFRDAEDSRYVALAMPRIILRLPYGNKTIPVESFAYEERVDGTDHDKYLWGNAAWALAARVSQAFSLYGWCGSIRGEKGGGLVQGLPVHTFKTAAGEDAMVGPAEMPITDRRENELAKLGFAALLQKKGTDMAAFFSVQSVQKPGMYKGAPAAEASAQLSAQLPYLFAASRFAHYLKVILRSEIGEHMTARGLQSRLQNWIANYTVSEDAQAHIKRERPLSAAQITVTEVEGRPGVYESIILLRPHYQLDAVNVSLRLVSELNQSA